MNAFMYALLTAGIWGLVPVIEKVGLKGVSPGVGLMYRGIGALVGVSFLGIYLGSTGVSLKADGKSILLLALGGLLASFVGQFFFYRGLKFGEASMVVPVAATYPLVSFIVAAIVLHERITMGRVTGIILVIAGVVLLKGK